VSSLPWTVLVNASGGWLVLARFVDESAAWSYGATQLEVRVRREGECLGHKDGSKEPWRACDRSGPCAPEDRCKLCRAALVPGERPWSPYCSRSCFHNSIPPLRGDP
jgi:hypothetical protein